MVAQFEREHPDIKVETLRFGTYYPEKISAMMVGNVAPDVMMVELSQYFELASRGVLLDLTDEFKELAAKGEYMPLVRRAFVWRDRCYALPINVPGFVTFVNLDVLAAAGLHVPKEGLSWEWLEQVAPRLSRRGGDPASPTDYAFVFPPTAQSVLWGYGVKIFDDDGHPTRATVKTPELREAFAYLRRVSAGGCVVPLTMINTAANTNVGMRQQLFRDGRVAFYFTGRWEIPYFKGKTSFNWDVMAIPAGPRARSAEHGGSGLAISARSKNQAAAKQFVQFYASVRGLRSAMRWGRLNPVYRELAFSDEFLNLRPPNSMIRFSEAMEAGASRWLLYAPGSAQAVRILNDTVEFMLSNPQVPLDEVTQRLDIELTRFLERQRRAGVL